MPAFPVTIVVFLWIALLCSLGMLFSAVSGGVIDGKSRGERGFALAVTIAATVSFVGVGYVLVQHHGWLPAN